MQSEHYVVTVFYIFLIAYTTYRIIMDTETPEKTAAYLLLIYGFPVIGLLTYYFVGVNYRKRKIYQKKLENQDKTLKNVTEQLLTYNDEQLQEHRRELGHFLPLAKFLKIQRSITSSNNSVELLVNGENKFPQLLNDLRQAKHHIHMQYYIYADDVIGNEVVDILIEKAQGGVEVRFTYDDFGSKLPKKFIHKLKEGGVQVFPFYKITLPRIMSRINYRNHRKIVVIDGEVGYVGGINVADKYINNGKNELFWRDTHIRLHGVSVLNLQFIFITDWNFCSKENLPFCEDYFKYSMVNGAYGNQLVQACYSGPDSDIPNIMYSLIQASMLAREELLITNPYFIPEKSFIDALKIASASGVNIKLLVPGISDSAIVNAIAMSYYGELLDMGIEIYRYQKGFVHAKTMVCDDQVAFVGTANLDERSFNLNFEVNATIYDVPFANQLKEQFYIDLEDAEQINPVLWKQRSHFKKFIDKVFRLVAPLM